MKYAYKQTRVEQRRSARYIVSIALFILLSLWIVDFAASVEHEHDDYLVVPEDKLNIMVWEHNDLNRELTVSLSGNISFPLIGEIRVAGKKTIQIEKDIAEKLAEGYIVNPQVTVSVLKFASAKQVFFILGEVKSPGKYEIEPGMNVLKAITMGGGLTAKAAPKRTSLIRVVDGKQTDSKATMGTLIKPGDTVLVPESFF